MLEQNETLKQSLTISAHCSPCLSFCSVQSKQKDNYFRATKVHDRVGDNREESSVSIC